MPVELHLSANTHAELCDKAMAALGIAVHDDKGNRVYFAPATPQQTVTMAQAWTLGANGETLFLGNRFDTELAERYKFIGRTVYMFGKDGIWRRAAEKTWVKLHWQTVEPQTEADR